MAYNNTSRHFKNGAWQFFKNTLGGGLPTPPAVLAMQGLIQSLGIFEDTLKCILPKVINGLETTIRNLLEDTLINVINGGICIVEQAAGSLVNDIAGKIESLLAGPLDAISVLVKFLGVPFNGIKNLLLSSQDVLAAIGGFFVCESEDKGSSKSLQALNFVMVYRNIYIFLLYFTVKFLDFDCKRRWLLCFQYLRKQSTSICKFHLNK